MAGMMGRTPWRLRLASVLVLLALSLSAFAGAASADPGPTPSGFTGACNMVLAFGVGAQGGMGRAMTVDNPNGNAGMWIAVFRSGNPPGECPNTP